MTLYINIKKKKFFTLGSDKVDKDEFENLLLYITSSKDYK